MDKEQAERRHRLLYFAVALFGGVLLAAFLWLMIALGDCWAGFDTPAEIQQCHQDKRTEMILFLVIVAVMWISALGLHWRKRGYPRCLAVFAGPFAFLTVSVAGSFYG